MSRIKPQGGEPFGNPEANGVHVINWKPPDDVEQGDEEQQRGVLDSIHLEYTIMRE